MVQYKLEDSNEEMVDGAVRYRYKFKEVDGEEISPTFDEMEEIARMFVGARIGGKAKEENAEANVNFKKEANKEPPEAGGPSTSRTTGVSVDKPGAPDGIEFTVEVSEIEAFVAAQIAALDALQTAPTPAPVSPAPPAPAFIAPEPALAVGEVTLAPALAPVVTPPAPAFHAQAPNPLAPHADAVLDEEARNLVQQGAEAEKMVILEDGGVLPIAINVLELFGANPNEDEVRNHPVFRYGFKPDPFPQGTPKPRGWKMFVVSAGTDVGMFSSWHEAGDHVVGIPHNIFKGYRNYQEACEKWRKAVMDGTVKMIFIEWSTTNLSCTLNAHPKYHSRIS